MTNIRDLQIHTRATGGAAKGEEVTAKALESTPAGGLPVTFQVGGGEPFTLTFKSAAAYRSFLNTSEGLEKLVDKPPKLDAKQLSALNAVRFSSDIAYVGGTKTNDPTKWTYAKETDNIRGMPRPSAEFKPIGGAPPPPGDPPSPDPRPTVGEPPRPTVAEPQGPRDPGKDPALLAAGALQAFTAINNDTESLATGQGTKLRQSLATVDGRIAFIEHQLKSTPDDPALKGELATLQQTRSQFIDSAATSIKTLIDEGDEDEAAAFIRALAGQPAGARDYTGNISAAGAIVSKGLAALEKAGGDWDSDDFLNAVATDGKGKSTGIMDNPAFAREIDAAGAKAIADTMLKGIVTDGDRLTYLQFAAVSNDPKTREQATKALADLAPSEALKFFQGLSGPSAGPEQKRAAAELMAGLDVSRWNVKDQTAFIGQSNQLLAALPTSVPEGTAADAKPAIDAQIAAREKLAGKRTEWLANLATHSPAGATAATGIIRDLAAQGGDTGAREAGQLTQAVLAGMQKKGTSLDDNFLLGILQDPKIKDSAPFADGLLTGSNKQEVERALTSVGKALLDGNIGGDERQAYVHLAKLAYTNASADQKGADVRSVVADRLDKELRDGVGFNAGDDFSALIVKEFGTDAWSLAASNPKLREKMTEELRGGWTTGDEAKLMYHLQLTDYVLSKPALKRENLIADFNVSHPDAAKHMDSTASGELDKVLEAIAKGLPEADQAAFRTRMGLSVPAPARPTEPVVPPPPADGVPTLGGPGRSPPRR